MGLELVRSIIQQTRLSNQMMEVDLNDYFIDNISKIIGILKYLIDAANL